MSYNQICIDRVASTILSLLDVKAPQESSTMAPPINEVVDKTKHCDRVFMYNPDAIAQWIYLKKHGYFKPILNENTLDLPMLSVMPSVTPACFASMYSGLKPKDHKIQSYTKPVLTCTTIFDILPRAGKKVAIVSTAGDSISQIFLKRDVDYYIYKTKQECNTKAMQLIEEDRHNLIVLYNGDYDYYMHRFTPLGPTALKALRENIATFNSISQKISTCWKTHSTALAFAPDHGCHFALFPPGNHGKNTEQDMNIHHFWKFFG